MRRHTLLLLPLWLSLGRSGKDPPTGTPPLLGPVWGALFKQANNSISHLIRQPERPPPKIMPCGTRRDLEADEELLLESVNYSNKENYPNSHVCEWHFLFPGRRARLHCPHFHLTEFLCLDYVHVGDGNTVHNNYCGRQGPRDLILVNKMSMRFSTSAFFPGKGFRCSLTPLVDDYESDDDDENHAHPEGEESPSSCGCGINRLGIKVVGGTPTLPGEVPWQAGLVRVNDTVPFCGGSLINDRYVLTAGHCVKNRTPYNLEVLLNTDKMVVGAEGTFPDRHQVAAITSHRNYTDSLDYDVALIKLASSVDLAQTPPICLPPKTFPPSFDNATATVTGWGYTTEGGELSMSLRKATVQVMSNAECREKYDKITDRMMCAASPGTDACQGDSGGPLFLLENEAKRRHTLIGIVSWGVGCARPGRPGVYTRVTQVLKWIRRTAKDGKYCGVGGNGGGALSEFKEVTIPRKNTRKHFNS